MKELEELLSTKLDRRNELTIEIMAIQKVLIMLKKEREDIKGLVKEAEQKQ